MPEVAYRHSLLTKILTDIERNEKLLILSRYYSRYLRYYSDKIVSTAPDRLFPSR